MQGALQQWLGELILVESVEVEAIDSTIGVTVRYAIRRSRERRISRFDRQV